MSKSLTVLWLATAVAIAACAPAKNSTPSTPETDTVVVSPEVADAVQASASLTCETPGGLCPAAVAMLISRTETDTQSVFQQCTSFLISSDVAVTNAHCFPVELRAAGAACRGYTLFFGDAGQGREAAGCDHVISASRITSNHKDVDYNRRPDYVIMKLTRKVKREPLQMGRYGVPDRTALQVLAIDPAHTQTTIHGILRIKPITTVQNSLVSANYSNDFGGVIAAEGTIIHGNSGSPAIDDRGIVRAVAQGSREGSNVKRADFKNLQLPASFNNAVLLTNSSCVEGPGLDQVSDACHADIISNTQFMKSLLAAASFDATTAFDAWQTDAPKILVFKNIVQQAGLNSVSKPEESCMIPPEQWIHRKPTELGLVSLTRQGSVLTAQYSIPLWMPKAQADSNLRITNGLAVADVGHVTLSFDLDQSLSDGYARVKRSLNDDKGFESETSMPFDLQFCH